MDETSRKVEPPRLAKISRIVHDVPALVTNLGLEPVVR
jgi:hypothetical protein